MAAPSSMRCWKASTPPRITAISPGNRKPKNTDASSAGSRKTTSRASHPCSERITSLMRLMDLPRPVPTPRAMSLDSNGSEGTAGGCSTLWRLPPWGRPMDAEAAGARTGTAPHWIAEQLGLGFERAAIGMALVDLDGRFVRVNQTLCDALGRAEPELLGTAIADLVGRLQLAGDWRRLWRAGGSFELERRLPRADGQPVDMRLRVEPLCDEVGRQVAYLVQAQDVTERNEVARALRTNVAWLRSVVANAPIVLSVYDRNGMCTFSEGRAFERVGVSPQERLGRTYAELRGDTDRANADLERLLAGEDVSVRRQVTPRPPHGEAVFEFHYRPLPAEDGSGEVAGVISVAVDVTDLERVERERRSLLHQLITAQESEQRRLAGNLHDDAIQALTAARMQLSVLEAQLDRGDSDVASEARVLAKQARAGAVRLRGWRGGPALEVEVADDGVGFDQAAVRRRAVATGHLGLRSMAERVEAAGGALRIDTAPGRGSRVRVTL